MRDELVFYLLGIGIVLAVVFTVGRVILGLFRFVRWLSTPTLRAYKRKHPRQASGNGIACASCGARSLRNWGVYKANGSLRVFICNHCGVWVHRG